MLRAVVLFPLSQVASLNVAAIPGTWRPTLLTRRVDNSTGGFFSDFVSAFWLLIDLLQERNPSDHQMIIKYL